MIDLYFIAGSTTLLAMLILIGVAHYKHTHHGHWSVHKEHELVRAYSRQGIWLIENLVETLINSDVATVQDLILSI